VRSDNPDPNAGAKPELEVPAGGPESARARLEEARNDVTKAEVRLEAVLAELRVSPRAEKVAVSRAIEDALQRLRNARTTLSAAEEIVSPIRR
jgi:hypothetical protein